MLISIYQVTKNNIKHFYNLVPPGYNLPGTVKKHANPCRSLPYHSFKNYNAIGVSKGKGKQVDKYGGQKGEGSGERGSRGFPISSGLKMRGDGEDKEVPVAETAAQRGQNINGTTTKEEIQQLINNLNKSLQANRRKNYIDKRRYKQYKANIEKEYKIRRIESNEFLKGIKDIAKKSRKDGEDFKQQKILEFNSMMGNDNK
ncbi:unnamed protein product [Meloidogyne enterolobii]|uniref:Uncharacterized protein n=1 Tax=Meloidogyne enterolobii TaxID=390850 RepID=A0ACB1AE13_MELEN